MKKIALFVPMDMPPHQRDVLACLPGDVDAEGGAFKLHPQIRSVSSIFEMMETIPMADRQGFATVELDDADIGPFLATCARTKSSVWEQAYSKVTQSAASTSAFMAQALNNEKLKAATGVENFVQSVAPASMGHRVFNVPVLGVVRAETPLPYDAFETDEADADEVRGSVNPTAQDFFDAARRGQVLSMDVGEARERAADEIQAAPERDDESMPIALQAEPTFLTNFAATMAVIARDAAQATQVAKAIVNDLQSPSEDVLSVVREVFVPRSSMHFFKESIRQDEAVSQAPADPADAPRMR